MSAKLSVTGKQGHVAYPQYADNAIHIMGKVVDALTNLDWDQGSDDFPGTSLQITHIHSGAFTDNLVPANCEICFNIRYSHCYDEAALNDRIRASIVPFTQHYELEWERPCTPFFTHLKQQDSLITAVEKAIRQNTGRFPVLSTSGGTSDGRFFAQGDCQVVELGVPNNTIHQVNERVHLADLVTLEDIYTDLLKELTA